jgi:hypothetical protein
MPKTKVVGRRKAPESPAGFHSEGAKLDLELTKVRPFSRKRGFVFKARTWDELANWESLRRKEEHRKL